jgi:DNA processing protein
MDACDRCLRRTDVIAALGGVIDVQWRTRGARAAVLGLSDEALLDLGPGESARRRYAGFDPKAARSRIEAARLDALCLCSEAYPERLRDLPDPPAVLHVAGDATTLEDADAVAVVGARRASPYGLEVARGLARALSAAGVPVVSGMALGVDSAAHAGALEGATRTVAVLAGGADLPYPASKRSLYAMILGHGCAVSELPPGFIAFRWCFPARNRLIAALARVVVVVEAAERSGSLITADFAADLGRPVAAVPGQVTSRLAGGGHALIKDGAALVADGGDVLDLLFEAGGRRARSSAAKASAVPALEPRLRDLLAAVEQGRGSLAALATSAEEAQAAMRGLTELELLGLVRREFGGRYARCL